MKTTPYGSIGLSAILAVNVRGSDAPYGAAEGVWRFSIAALFSLAANAIASLIPANAKLGMNESHAAPTEYALSWAGSQGFSTAMVRSRSGCTGGPSSS